MSRHIHMGSGTSGRIAALVPAFFIVLAEAALGYEIGHTSMTYLDPARGNRPVQTEIFYPADIAGEDVPIAAPPQGGFPSVSFGHGFLMAWDLYDYLWDGLVPGGYIVALPATEQGLLPSHLEFGRDLAFVLRSLRASGEDPGSVLFGGVGDRGAVMGHSMGGGASFLGAAEDPTVSAIANLAAAETSPSAIAAAADIGVPALVFSGANDCVTPPAQHQVPMYGALASDCKTRVTIAGASHCQFGEYSWVCSLGEGGCPSPTITREEQHSITLALLRPWLDYALKDDLWGWLEFQDLLETTPGIVYEQACEAASVAEGSDGDAGGGVLALSPSFPNPFNDTSSLVYTLAAPAHVRVRVISLAGRVVATLEDGRRDAGSHSVLWDGRDSTGHRAAAGVYCCEVEAAGERERSAMVCLR